MKKIWQPLTFLLIVGLFAVALYPYISNATETSHGVAKSPEWSSDIHQTPTTTQLKQNTQAQIQELMTQCDKNNDGAIKWIFEKKCYLKGKNAIIREDIAKNREDIAKLDENIAKNREEIARSDENIARLNRKGQEILDEMRADAWISH